MIHTVGAPRWLGGSSDETALLVSCHLRSIELAAELGCSSVAFPAISTGLFGYPVELAAPVALRAAARGLADHPQVELVRFVLYDEHTYRSFERASQAR